MSIRFMPREAQVWLFTTIQTADGWVESWAWACDCGGGGYELESMEDACRRLHHHTIEKHPSGSLEEA